MNREKESKKDMVLKCMCSAVIVYKESVEEAKKTGKTKQIRIYKEKDNKRGETVTLISAT